MLRHVLLHLFHFSHFLRIYARGVLNCTGTRCKRSSATSRFSFPFGDSLHTTGPYNLPKRAQARQWTRRSTLQTREYRREWNACLSVTNVNVLWKVSLIGIPGFGVLLDHPSVTSLAVPDHQVHFSDDWAM